MTKYEMLYGVPVSYFPHEEENAREKLRLVTEMLGKIYKMERPYTYDNSCEVHELEEAQESARNILMDIEDG